MLSKSFLRSTIAVLALTVPLLGAGIVHTADAAAGKTKKKCSKIVKKSCAKTVKASCASKVSAKGCSGSCAGDCSKAKACCRSAAAKMKAKHVSAIKAVVTDLPYNESKRLVLRGKYVCGKCQLQKFEKCQAMFKTESGELYPLISNGKVMKMKKMKSSDGYQITTRIKRIDGIKHLQVINFTEM
jgi:hypothetical protein